jgi:MFS family permease
VLAAALFGLGLIAFSRSRSVGLSMLVLAITGFGMIVQTASSNTILQTIVDEDKRGRVMSLYTMAFTGMMPLGSLLAGAMAGRFGAPTTIALGGATVVAGAAVFASRLRRLRAHMRPIYVRLGILPGSDAGGPSPSTSS